MGRTPKTYTAKEKIEEWEPICPRCGRARPVGTLCGGTHPKLYCRDCLIEFSVKKKRGRPVSATVVLSTASGIRTSEECYIFDEDLQKFTLLSTTSLSRKQKGDNE